MRDQIQRQAERQRKRSALGDIRPGRDPRIIFLAMFVLAICGALLFSRSSDAGKRQLPIDKRLQIVDSELEVMRVAAERFNMDVGRYPTPEEGVIGLVQRPEGLTNWGGHYVTIVTPDPWKTPYRCDTTPNDLFRISSAGPDKRFDTPDDIHADSLDTIVARQLRRYHTALAGFKRDTGRYPTKMEGLRALLQAPKVEGWRGPYMRYLPRDPWNRDYYFISQGTSYTLHSVGPDQTPLTDDDIALPTR